jgi:uncharacterized peroxidase-related enzyme
MPDRTATADALERGERPDDLSVRESAMLAYAAALTRDPAGIGSQDVEALRGAGLSDAAILDVCQIAAYYAFVNRLANGLGVELEDWWEEVVEDAD